MKPKREWYVYKRIDEHWVAMVVITSYSREDARNQAVRLHRVEDGEQMMVIEKNPKQRRIPEQSFPEVLTFVALIDPRWRVL